MPTEIKVTQDISSLAYERARGNLGIKYEKFNLETEQRLSVMTMEAIGELVFKEFLELQKISFESRLYSVHQEKYIFILNQKAIETKTIGFKSPNEWQKLNGFYDVTQIEKALASNIYSCVQIFINGYNKVNKLFNKDKCDVAIIAGWMEISEILLKQTKYLPLGKAHILQLEELTETSELFS